MSFNRLYKKYLWISAWLLLMGVVLFKYQGGYVSRIGKHSVFDSEFKHKPQAENEVESSSIADSRLEIKKKVKQKSAEVFKANDENKVEQNNEYDVKSNNVKEILDKTIAAITWIQDKAQNDPKSLEYTDAFENADVLLKKAKTLKPDLQIGASIVSSRPSEFCTGHSCQLDRPIEQLVTIVMNLVESPTIVSDRLSIVLNAIQQEHPYIHVHVGIPQHYTIDEDHITEGTIKIRWMRGSTAAEVWNRLVNNSLTPFVLIARDLLHFDKNAFLEKQMKVLLTTGAVAVGGATRNLEGFWRSECYQMSMGVYTLKLEDGYRRSFEGCMKCDYMGGAFLIRKEKFKLDSTLYPKETFIDFFFYLFKENIVLFVCTDVMYYQMHTNLSELVNTDLQRFGTKENLDTFPFPENTIHLSCSQIKQKCDARTPSLGLSLPRCCARERATGLSNIFKYFKAHGMEYYITCGVLVTAIKIKDVAPWDGDADTEATLKTFDFMKDNENSLRQQGYTIESTADYRKLKNKSRLNRNDLDLKKKEKVYWIIKFGSSKLEFTHYGFLIMEETIGNLPQDLRLNRTLVNVADDWYVSPSNPGLWVKETYGKDTLKHMYRRDFKMGDRNPVLKFFSKCPSTKKQECLNMLDSDGNLDLFP